MTRSIQSTASLKLQQQRIRRTAACDDADVIYESGSRLTAVFSFRSLFSDLHVLPLQRARSEEETDTCEVRPWLTSDPCWQLDTPGLRCCCCLLQGSGPGALGLGLWALGLGLWAWVAADLQGAEEAASPAQLWIKRVIKYLFDILKSALDVFFRASEDCYKQDKPGHVYRPCPSVRVRWRSSVNSPHPVIKCWP